MAAALLMAAIKLGLTLLPYRKLCGLVDRLGRTAPRLGNSPAASPERIAWVVARASCFVPGATCLTQALVAKVLLERCGHPTLIRVGIARTDEALIAHAWVENDGRVVVGGSDLMRYTPLLGLEAIGSRAMRPRG